MHANRIHSRRTRVVTLLVIVLAALTLVGASRVTAAPGEPTTKRASARATITLGPGSVTGRDIRNRSVQIRHLGTRTVETFIGSGRVSARPRATSATRGWLFFAEDVDGGALFRSDGRTWVQLTTGRLGRIARNSIDSSRIAPGGIVESRLADRAVSARTMSMDAWRAISTSGPLASRPDARSRPAGSFWFAPDDAGGTLYQSDGQTWVRVSSVGSVSNLAPASVTSAELAPAAVTSASVAPNSIGSSAIAPDAITAVEIASGAVGSSELAVDAVTASAIASGSVGSDEIVDGSVAIADIDPAVFTATNAAGTLAARPAAAASNEGYLYLATDDAGGTLSRSDGGAWQAVGHTRQPRTITYPDGQWANQPAAFSELYAVNRSRVPVDLSSASQVRLFANVSVIGFTTPAILCAQYSIDAGASWLNFNGTAGTACASGIAQVAINVLGLRTSAWQAVPSGARIEGALVRIAGSGGNGTVDPTFGVLGVELR